MAQRDRFFSMGGGARRRLTDILRAGGVSVSTLSPKLQAKLVVLETQIPSIVLTAGRYATREAVKRTQQLFSRAFNTERYYKPGPRGGTLAKLRANSPAYMKYKRDRSMDMRRGHVSGRLQNAIDNMVSATPSGLGIAVDLERSAGEHGAGEYASYYEEAKAPGLGSPRSIPRMVYREWERELKRRVRADVSAKLRSIRAPQLIPVLLSDRRLAALIGRVGVKLKVG